MHAPGLEELNTGIQRLPREAIALKPDETKGEGDKGNGTPELSLTSQSRDKDGLMDWVAEEANPETEVCIKDAHE